MPITFSTNFPDGTYQETIRNFLVLTENPSSTLNAHFEGASIAIGYGYDLLQHNNTQVIAALGSVGLTVTNQQLQMLNQARAGDAVQRQQVANDLNLSLATQRDALTLVDYVLANEYETRLNRLTAGINLPQSMERVALLSMVYNGRLQNYGGNYLVLTPLLDALRDGNRAESWLSLIHI